MALRCRDSGAGELIINNVDLDGSRRGYDITLMESLNRKLTIPLVALGGCGSLKHIKDLLSASPISEFLTEVFLYAKDTEQVLLNLTDKKKWLKDNLKNLLD